MSDLIDRQAVIDLLKQMRKDGDMVPWEGKDVFARIRKLPTIQPEKAQLSKEDATSDLISRQQALNALIYAVKNVGILDADDIRTVFKALPTIQPEPCGDKSYTLWKESYEELKRRMDELTACSDTISRQAAIDAVEKNACNTQRIMDAVNNLPSAQSEPQWIPVSERLPEESGYYITSNEYCGVNEDFYYDGHFWNADKNAYEVIAWMPKPEHYKPNK